MNYKIRTVNDLLVMADEMTDNFTFLSLKKKKEKKKKPSEHVTGLLKGVKKNFT